MDEEIKKLIEKNLELTKEIHQMTKSIKGFVITERIWFFVKLLIILVPIILGLIYLPPLMKNLLAPYQELLNMTGTKTDGNILENLLNTKTDQIDLNQIDPNSLPPEAKKLLK